VGVPGDLTLNTAWQDWLNVRSQLVAARLITASALERRESRGAHFRRDHPGPEPGPPFAVHAQQAGDGPRVWREPVAFTRVAPPGVPAPAAVEARSRMSS
jgi:succinate dehydrogenase/fumarate reductase flavoprotein subunit